MYAFLHDESRLGRTRAVPLCAGRRHDLPDRIPDSDVCGEAGRHVPPGRIAARGGGEPASPRFRIRPQAACFSSSRGRKAWFTDALCWPETEWPAAQTVAGGCWCARPFGPHAPENAKPATPTRIHPNAAATVSTHHANREIVPFRRVIDQTPAPLPSGIASAKTMPKV